MGSSPLLTRRLLLGGAASTIGLALTGCASNNSRVGGAPRGYYQEIYGAMPHERFPIPAIRLERVPRRFYRQQVYYETSEAPGTIIVDTDKFYLYLVQRGGTAMRYGVGLGRAGFQWSGRARIGRKQAWPTWTPPQEMIKREPYLVKYSAANGGMEPGLYNPLGARALYIFQDGRDTLYRIHGSPEYWTIGKAVSSGCVRMLNQDVIDLYQRAPVGAPVLVL